MAGRSNTFFLGGQANAVATLERGLTFSPQSVTVDNNGPQSILLENPPVVIPPYTVGRTIPIPQQTNRVKATATGLSATGNPASLTYNEDALPATSGVSTQVQFNSPNVDALIWQAAGTAAVFNLTSLTSLPAGLYRVLSVIMGMLQPNQNAVGLTCAPVSIPLAINAVYSPFAAFTLPAPTEISSTGAPVGLQVLKSDGTTSVEVYIVMYVLPLS